MLGGGRHRVLAARLIRENLIKRQAIQGCHTLGKVNTRKLRAGLNPRQVARIGAKLTGRFNQAQPHGESFVAKGTHDGEYIAPSAICKSSAVCAWRETIGVCLAQDKAMEQGHHIGWAIKQVIEARDIPQLRLADLCDKDPGTITRWLKHGKTIGSEYVKIIADFLGMKVSDLYKIAEEGIFRPITAEDERKARLKAMIDGLDPSQLSILFPENPADPQRETSRKAA